MYRTRGSILVVSLFVMISLSFVALSLAYRGGMRRRTVRQVAVHERLQIHAQSAVAIAIGRLAENTNNYDHFAEPWHSHASLGSEDWLPEWQDAPDGGLAEYETDYYVIDEEGKLNILFAASSALESMGMSADQVASLFDWMDDDNLTRSGGAESDFYEAQTPGYRCKNGALQLLDELQMIRNFTAASYYGEDANRNRVLDANENDGSLSYPADNADGMLQFGWVDLLTTYGTGLINLNTAPRPVLAVLPISETAVNQIIGYRTFDAGSSGNLEDHVFVSATDIEQLQGLTEAERSVLTSIAAYKSTHFRIFAVATHITSDLQYTLEVAVKMTDDGPVVLQWKAGG